VTTKERIDLDLQAAHFQQQRLQSPVLLLKGD